VTAVPEPVETLMAIVGLIGAFSTRWRRRLPRA
jgi:hypothetical protein